MTDQTISYSRILEHRRKAVKIDLGEQSPVWFPLHKIKLDEQNYTLSGEDTLIFKKITEAQGQGGKPSDFNADMVKLATPSWQSDSAIGIDVIVSCLSAHAGGYKKRVFFGLSKIENGCAPRWLVNAKEKEIITEAAKRERKPEDTFVIRGLKAKAKKSAA